MKKMAVKRIVSGVMVAAMMLNAMVFSGGTVFAADNAVNTIKDVGKKPLRLWYNAQVDDSYNGDGANRRPMQDFSGSGAATRTGGWEGLSLPIGNGFMGANVFGRIAKEKIHLNEKTLWSGGPSPSRPNYDGGNKNTPVTAALQEARDKIAANTSIGTGDGSLGQLIGEGAGGGYGNFLSWGDLYFDFGADFETGITEYVRDLDLDKSLSGVRFKRNGVQHTRENFMSYPDNIMVNRITSGGTNDLTFTVDTVIDKQDGSRRTDTRTATGDTITITGSIDDNGMRYAQQTKVIATGGTVVANADGTIRVTNAEEVMVLTAMATDYAQDYPKYRTGIAPIEGVRTRINNASKMDYTALYNRHFDDYSNLFSRVSLDLNHTVDPTKPTDVLLADYKKIPVGGVNDKAIEVLLFQYGRYLLISSSREGSLPANLQGVWNYLNNPTWGSDYHMNINLQMNYWPAYVTNLTETSVPLTEYVDSLRAPGRVTAKIYNGIESKPGEENGWVAHTQNTPFGWTCPGWAFAWGWSPGAAPWIVQNVWERYEFDGDKEYLKNNIYPILRETVMFWNQYLVYDAKTGRYVSTPSFSPEHGSVTTGNTYEQTLVWQLFTDFLTAAEELNVDYNLRQEVEEKLVTLNPTQVNSRGMIKEWFEEDITPGLSTGEREHRHMSNLLGLYPGNSITKDTPEFFEAAKRSMLDRGTGKTGWGIAQRIATYPRVLMGNQAYKHLQDLFHYGILRNLWDTHGPFQIDGNFGATSGMAEMLLQSHIGYIQPLPALPDAWAKGSYTGLVARGNFVVDAAWDTGKNSVVDITSKNGGACKVSMPNVTTATITKNGTTVAAADMIVDSKADMVTIQTVPNDVIKVIVSTTAATKLPAAVGSAARVDDNTVSVEWGAVAGATKYDVYKKTGETGEFVRVAQGLTTLKYSDTSALSTDVIKYKVYAYSDTAIGTDSAVISVSSLIGDVKLDDRDPRVTYVGNWQNWADPVLFRGTEKYIKEAADASNNSCELKFVGTGLKINGMKTVECSAFNLYVDGVFKEKVSVYVSGATIKPALLYTIENLPLGTHTMKLEMVADGGRHKVSLDSFEIIGQPTAPPPIETDVNPTAISITSSNKIFEINKQDSTLQLGVDFTPTNTTNKGVRWTVTQLDGNVSPVATISSAGLLTVNNRSGKVKVKATSTATNTVIGEKEIVVNIGGSPLVTWYDDRDSNAVWTNMSDWNNDAQQYKGTEKFNDSTNADSDTKRAAGQVGGTFTFTGTGISVIGNLNTAHGYSDVEIDGALQPNKLNLYDSTASSGKRKQVAFTKTGLENRQHTLKIMSRKGSYTGANPAIPANNSKISLDAFEVLSANNYADKQALITLVETSLALHKIASEGTSPGDYAVGSKVTFMAAIDAAATIANTATTTVENVAAAVTALTNAKKAFTDGMVAGAKSRLVTFTVAGAGGSVSVQNGTTTVNSGDKVPEGTALTFTMSPIAGFAAKSITVNNTVVPVTGNTATITTAAGEDTVATVRFRKQEWNVTRNNATNGIIATNAFDGKVEDGSLLNITLTPNEGYRVATATISGVSFKEQLQDLNAGRSLSYTAKVNSDVTIAATYEQIPSAMYTITVKPTANVVVVANTYNAVDGTSIRVDVVGSANSIIVKGADDSVIPFTKLSAQQYAFIMPSKNVTVQAADVSKVDLTIVETPQSKEHTGAIVMFDVITTPSNVTGFVVKYKQGANEVTPINSGTYDVIITRPADDNYNAFSKTITGGLVIKAQSELKIAIAQANEKYKNAVPGTSIGNYPQAEITAFKMAIDAAQIVDNNTNASATEIANAVAALASATTKFDSSKITSIVVDKTVLIAAIAEATYMHTNSVDGNSVGEYPIPARTNLMAAINAATIVNNNTSATELDVSNAISELQRAVTIFEGLKVSDIARKPGDISGDGLFNIADALYALKIEANAIEQPVGNRLLNGDMNRDGKITRTDVVMLLTLALDGIEPRL